MSFSEHLKMVKEETEKAEKERIRQEEENKKKKKEEEERKKKLA